MPSATYQLFRDAILAERQVTCRYQGRLRKLCPHIIGHDRSGDEKVLSWQFGGESSGRLPQWRCMRLREVTNALSHDGPWHAGRSHKAKQSCVTKIDLDINVHVRKLAKPGEPQ